MEENKIADEIIKSLDVNQKAQLLSQVIWETTSIDKIDQRLEKFLLADGPAGIRRLKEYFDDDIYNTKPSTSYPSPSTYASSWDPNLAEEIGKHIGREALQENVDTMLAPAINLKRSPLAGRNFEYYSEDPNLTSELATSFIKGIQSEGVGACLKHFALNNQETRRMNINVNVDEQTLHELYLRTFEKPVKVGKPRMIMTSYSQVNGDYCASNPLLLDTLRKKWGFEGVIVTDCFAAHNLSKGLNHGLSLQMPGETKEKITKQVKDLISSGDLTEDTLNQAVKYNIIFDLISIQNKSKRKNYNREQHHNFARKVAEQSMVLLKNENKILPLDHCKQSILVVGELAKKPRFQGGGSSHVNPYKLEIPLTEINKFSTNITFAKGYKLDGADDKKLSVQAIEQAKEADRVVIFAGLPDLIESEGYDRKDLNLPKNQNDLIMELTKVNKEVIVVLANGSVVEMPWKDNVQAILESYLSGESGASAIANILFGKVNPSGHLAESFPESLKDNPTYLNFPGNQHDVVYGEGRFIGYKYYSAMNKKVAFPFGFGLSYTNFDYKVQKNWFDGKNKKVKLNITNTGSIKGKNVVQVYTKYIDSVNNSEPLQLGGFLKINLDPGESKDIEVQLDSRVFETYDVTTHKWIQQAGHYELFVGNSSVDHQIMTVINIKAKPVLITADHSLGDLLKNDIEMYKKLSEEFKNHPKSLDFLEMTHDEDPLKSVSMGSLMTLNTLKRADPTMDDTAIQKIIADLNDEGANNNAKY